MEWLLFFNDFLDINPQILVFSYWDFCVWDLYNCTAKIIQRTLFSADSVLLFNFVFVLNLYYSNVIHCIKRCHIRSFAVLLLFRTS